MKKLIITEDVATALNQLIQWAKCEATSWAVQPVWQVISKQIVEEDKENEV